jgi:iron complex transport system permease protein
MSYAKVNAHLTLAQWGQVLALLILGLLISVVMGLKWGSESVSWATIFRLLSAAWSVGQNVADSDITSYTILVDIRLPRVLFAIVTGAALSVAGAGLQALLRNPLADPYVLGVSSGAAVGAVLALILISNYPLAQPAGAFLGALVTTLVVYILAGAVTTSFLWAAIVFLLTLTNSLRLRGITFWLMGDLSFAPRNLLAFTAFFIVLGIVSLMMLARPLNIIMISDAGAQSLGIPVAKLRLAVYILASLLTGVTVAVAGTVGYVGLIVPHLVRLAWSSDNRLVLPASALLGATMLLIADTIARTAMAPRELPVGAVTALLGAPLFVYLLRRRP